MSAIYKNGIAYGGAASAANLISATGGDGTATNVQAELNNINENISSLNDDLTNIHITIQDVNQLATILGGEPQNTCYNFYCLYNVTNVLTGGAENVSGRGFFSHNGNIIDFTLSAATHALYQGRYNFETKELSDLKKFIDTTALNGVTFETYPSTGTVALRFDLSSTRYIIIFFRTTGITYEDNNNGTVTRHTVAFS